jgi:tRNA-Thr(GGU) m(6)t(6)A37 methyltransferase TsaA
VSIESSLTLGPIGYIRTPYHAKSEAPHQPNPDEAVEGVVELLPGQNFEQAAIDLEGMDKIWLIYWFDRNPNWKPKVLVPRGPVQKRGVFATRSPHRPNPIGLTLVDLVKVDGLTLHVRNVDLLDGTPILDIKPYLPKLEAHPDAKAGWIDAVEEADTEPRFTVSYSEHAANQLDHLESHAIQLRSRIEHVLSRVAAPHPYRRIERDSDGLYLAYRAWRIRFTVEDDRVTITQIRSGYPKSAFESGEELADDEAQRAFAERFGY